MVTGLFENNKTAKKFYLYNSIYFLKLAVVRIQKASDNMKILITGAHGFVGNRLMQDLPDAAAAPSMRGHERRTDPKDR